VGYVICGASEGGMLFAEFVEVVVVGCGVMVGLIVCQR
jgi:hypothetical protein